jgi:hypothetical protein
MVEGVDRVDERKLSAQEKYDRAKIFISSKDKKARSEMEYVHKNPKQ